jgi:hypothetical protein
MQVGIMRLRNRMSLDIADYSISEPIKGAFSVVVDAWEQIIQERRSLAASLSVIQSLRKCDDHNTYESMVKR